MPAQSLRSTVSGVTPKVPFNGHYPKLLQGRVKASGKGGSVWLVTAPNTGVIVALATTPQKTKHKLGYYTTRLKEGVMDEFKGNITISA